MSKFTITEKEFKGIAGAKAYHSALALIRSLWYIPKDIDHDSFVEMSNWFDKLDDENKRKYLKLAVEDGAMLQPEEIESLLKFAKDENGVPICKENIENLTGFEIHDLILNVSCEILKSKVFFYQTNK